MSFFYTFKNGEKQGDNNSVNYFSRQLCAMCEVKGQILTCFYVHACMVLQFSREYNI